MTTDRFFGNNEAEKLKKKDYFPERSTEKFAPNALRCLNSRAVRLTTSTVVQGDLKEHFAMMDKSRASKGIQLFTPMIMKEQNYDALRTLNNSQETPRGSMTTRVLN